MSGQRPQYALGNEPKKTIVAKDMPRRMTHLKKAWYYAPDKYLRDSRGVPRHMSLGCYVPVAAIRPPGEDVVWPRRAYRDEFSNEVFLFKKTCTAKDLAKELDDTEANFDFFTHQNRYQDACYVGTIMLYHLILLLRPEDGAVRRQNARYSFPKHIAGKICHPEGDLLILPNLKSDHTRERLTSVCHVLRYLQKVMDAINLLPGPHVTPREKFGASEPSHLREDRPSLKLLKEHNLPESSETHLIRLADPNLSSFSKFFKPLFTSKYIFLENEKTRYTVEALQLSFVAFQQLADMAIWSGEYAYALFLVQNMLLLIRYLDILLPVPELRRYYTYTMTYWYCARVYFKIGTLDQPHMMFREKYKEISRYYQDWNSFYSGLEQEIQTTLPESYEEVDRSKLFRFPERGQLIRSAEYYLKIKIPCQWKKSKYEQNYVIFNYCTRVLKDWPDSLRSSKTNFLFKERKEQLYSILRALDCVQNIKKPGFQSIALCLCKAKCLYYLSTLDVSQLINWCPRGMTAAHSIDVYSFEKILNSVYKVIVEDCEVNVVEVEQETGALHLREVAVVQPTRANTGSEDSASSLPKNMPELGHSTGVVYRISNIPIAFHNAMKAHQYRIEGFNCTDTSKTELVEFSNKLTTAVASNIMIYYIHLLEYETDRNALSKMNTDFGEVLDKWFPEKKNKRRHHKIHFLLKADVPLVDKTVAYMFMGGCLSFYLLYRLGGDKTFYNNARYYYALMASHVLKKNLWDTVLKALAGHADTRALLLLDCHDNLRRRPDRCVAVIRSYLYMLPLLYELCIMRRVHDGPTNCPCIRATDVIFPLHTDASLDTDIKTKPLSKILGRVRHYLRKNLRFEEQGGIVTLLEPDRYFNGPFVEDILQYDKKFHVGSNKREPEYPVLQRWSWVQEEDNRPLCTGDDDCKSAPCTVEEYIDQEENVKVDVLHDDPNLLNKFLAFDSETSSALLVTLSRVKKSLKTVTNKLHQYLDALGKRYETSEKKPYVRVCIPGISSDDSSRAVPNGKSEDLPLPIFLKVLTQAKDYLSDHRLPDDLAICKALLCLDSVLNLKYTISDILRGSMPDVDRFLKELNNPDEKKGRKVPKILERIFFC